MSSTAATRQTAVLVWLAVCAGTLATLGGCAGRVPAPRPAPGYDQRIDGLDAVDTTRLRGRRIAIDPGHGGRFRGSLGVNGLTEAEANLGVALCLRDLLEARGAIVFMTRVENRDFLTPADSSLRADLAERVRIANAFTPELFVSIHHNADAGGAHDVNETQTYYRFGDEGPSLDAAESVHRYLVRNLGIRAHRILPGNYFVLRNSNAPALLTESSYITNPDVEARLVQPAKQLLEAEALYLGITHFFARGTPVIESFVARAAPGMPADSAFYDAAAPMFEAWVSGAFDIATLRLGGVPVPLERFGARLIGRPRGVLAHGAHEAVLEVRRAGAGAATPVRRTFAIARPIEQVVAAVWPAHIAASGQTIGVRFMLTDRFGSIVPDSIPIRVVSAGARCDTTVMCHDGVAWIYLHRLSPGRLTFDLQPLDGRDGVWMAAVQVAAATGQPRTWSGFASEVGAHGAASLAGAPGTREPAAEIEWLNRDGFAVLPADSAGRARVPRLKGYRAHPGALERDDPPVGFTPIAGGALHGRRIVLDPDGGGDVAAGVGPSGTRAALVNLRVARILAGFLQAAGARVQLTRDGDDALSDIERVRISESFGAERYLRIGHRAAPPRIGHFYSSTAGRAWARRTAESLELLGLAAPSIADDAQYPLQQTSCPALYVSLARVDEPRSEDSLFQPGALRAEAYALYLGLVREWRSDAAFTADSLFVHDAGGKPVRGAAVMLGDALMLESDPDGRIRFARTEPGPLEAAVVDSRVRARMILLDSTQGAILTGPRGR